MDKRHVDRGSHAGPALRDMSWCQAPGHGRRGHGLKVCVVGCGAVGSLFAASLSQLDDVEVWAYDLARDHVDAINRDGLRLSGAGELVGRIRATTDPGELPPCEFGI